MVFLDNSGRVQTWVSSKMPFQVRQQLSEGIDMPTDQIRVNAINADQVDTPLFRRFVAERAAKKGISVEEQLALYRERNVMHTSLIPPEAVADLAVLLASDKFRYTTGDILTIDGGLPDAFPR